jgi:hypothetical protein
MLSEAELHPLKIRLHAGERQKAERGERHQALPVGLERPRDGSVLLLPDEEIRARLSRVFRKFEALGSARAVMRYLQQASLPLPTRPLQGPAPHEIIWQPASASRVLAILHHPAYAGAYGYGRKTADPPQRPPGQGRAGQVRRPLAQWPVCLQGLYPAYIRGEQYLNNQARLRDNQHRYQADPPGVPRQGHALLHGIVVCGRCGARRRLRYSGPHGEYPVYECNIDRHAYDRPRCQAVRALGLEGEVERLLHTALEPDKLARALSTLEPLEPEAEALQRQGHLRLERARYEAERARRQYNALEPEHRRVARSLQRQGEERLRSAEALEQAYPPWGAQQQFMLTEDGRQAILALGQDLPRVWYAATTTSADRKPLLRRVIRSVIVDAKRVPGPLWCQINWQTGATSDYWFRRHVQPSLPNGRS